MPQGTHEDAISLALGHPAPEALPWAALRDAAPRALVASRADEVLQYGPETGAPELVAYLARRAGVAAASVMLVPGSTGAVDMLARLYGASAGVVLVEAPSYRDSLHVFRDHRLRVVAAAMDDEGVAPGALEAALAALVAAGTPPAFFYTIPTFHNPTGITPGLARRRAVLDLCLRYGVLIVEDDVYRELAFDGDAPPSYHALAGGEGVVHIGSFSKTLAPGLRLGWMLAPEPVIDACAGSGVVQMGGGANPLDACMPPGARWTRPGGGFFVWLTLPRAVDASAFQRRTRAAGVQVSAGHTFFAPPLPELRHIRLAFSYAAPDALAEGVGRLATVLRALL